VAEHSALNFQLIVKFACIASLGIAAVMFSLLLLSDCSNAIAEKSNANILLDVHVFCTPE
jgi:hypothetical protein